MTKNTAYLCPECGEEIDLEIIDTEFDDSALSCKMSCATCGAVWYECFALHYGGYTYRGASYDADGKRITP